jgi:hypothetical protein
MNQYKFNSGFNLKLFVVIASVVLLVTYGLFNARDMLIGPTLEIFSPDKNIETKSNMLSIKGRAENISFISLNDKPIHVDTEGFFEEKLLLDPGQNIIEIKARDRFRKEVAQTINVYYKQGATTSTSETTNM